MIMGRRGGAGGRFPPLKGGNYSRKRPMIMTWSSHGRAASVPPTGGERAADGRALQGVQAVQDLP